MRNNHLPQKPLSLATFSARRKLYLAIVAATQFMTAGHAWANPEGGQVVGGAGNINQSGTETVIHQQTERMAIDWQSFDVKSNEHVQFVQPNASSVALNRVLSNKGSEILGRIDANGQVFLVNPNGVVFGKDSQINVGGILASGLTIKPTEFMNGNFTLNSAEGTEGKVINSGIINAATGGSVTLLGKGVKNEGLIIANLGAVSLAAGNEAVVTFDASGLMGVRVTKAILQDDLGVDAAVVNSGEINAQGGRILLTASTSQDIFSQAVNHNGLNAATSVVVNEDGSFTLGAGADVVNTGSIRASSSAGDAGQIVAVGNNVTNAGTIAADSQAGVAGHIELNSTDTTLINQAAIVSAQATTTGVGGDVKILGNKVGLLDNAKVSAAGVNGGGQVLIGGDQTGKNNRIRNADFIYLGENTEITTDALVNGNGGRLITFASDTARVYGNLFARGGSESGNGGFIETSGLKGFELGKTPNFTASNGVAGAWLIDPQNITIAPGTQSGQTTAAPNFLPTQDSATLGVKTITDALAGGGTVTVSTGNNSPTDVTVKGDITLTTPLLFSPTGSKTATLQLLANNNIDIQDSISTGSNDTLNIVLRANYNSNNPGNTGSGTGSITVTTGKTISTDGGSFTASGVDFTSGSSANNLIYTQKTDDTQLGGAVALEMTGAVNIKAPIITRGGNFTVGKFDVSGNPTQKASSFDSTDANASISTRGYQAGGNISIAASGTVNLGLVDFSHEFQDNNTFTWANIGSLAVFGQNVTLASDLNFNDTGWRKADGSGLGGYNADGTKSGSPTLKTFFNITATNNININGSIYDQYGDARDALDINFSSTAGSINITKDIYTAGGNLVLSAGGGVDFHGVVIDTDNANKGNVRDKNNTTWTQKAGDWSNGGDISISATTTAVLGTIVSDVNHTTGVTPTGNLTVTALDSDAATPGVQKNLSVSQAASSYLNITGASTFDLGGGDAILNNAEFTTTIFNNGVGTSTAVHNLFAAAKNLAFTSANNVDVKNYGATKLGAATIGGTFKLTSAGDITQSGILSVLNDVTTFITSPASKVILNTSQNTFSSFASISGISELTLTNTGNVVFNNVTTTGGNVDINVSSGTLGLGAITTSSATLNAGNITLTADNGINLTGNISAKSTASAHNGGTITFNDDVLLKGNIVVDTSGGTGGTRGDISFQGAINSFDTTQRDLSLTGKTISFASDVGATHSLNNFSLDSTANLNAAARSFHATSFNAIATGLTAASIDTSGENDTAGGIVNISTTGVVTITEIDASGGTANTVPTTGKDGGAISIAGTDITLGDSTHAINSSGSVGTVTTGKAGDIILTATDNLTNGTPTITINGNLIATGNILTSNPVQLILVGGASAVGVVDLSQNTSAFTSNINITGSSGTDTLKGPNIAATWTIDGVANNINNKITFSSFENLLGSSAVDTFTITAAFTGNIKGGDGNNIFNIGANVTNKVEGGNDNDTFNITTTGALTAVLDGGSGTDTLVGANRPNDWSLGTTESLNSTLTFTNIENITGNADVDTFTFSGVRNPSGIIDAKGNTDIINVSTDATIDYTGAFSLFGVINAEVVHSQGGGKLTAASNTNQNITWTIANAGNKVTDGSHEVQFTNFNTLTGGNGNDTFNVTGTAKVSGLIDGMAGTNVLDLSLATGAYKVEIASVVGTADLTVNGMSTIIGNDHANSVLINNSGNNTWKVFDFDGASTAADGINDGTVGAVKFVNFKNLTAGSGDDTFDFSDVASGSITGTIDGGTGTNTIKARVTGANTWSMTSNTDGSLAETASFPTNYVNGFKNIQKFVGAGTDTMDFSGIVTDNVKIQLATGVAGASGVITFIGNNLSNSEIVGGSSTNSWDITAPNAGTVGTINFSKFKNVTGGTGDDNFTIESGASVSGKIDGDTGTNKIINKNNSASWVLDSATAHKGTLNGKSFLNIGEITGSGSDTLTGRNQDNAWSISGANSGTVNLSGNTSDQMIFGGIANLIGLAGADVFTFGASGSLVGSIDGGTGVGSNKVINNGVSGVWILDPLTADKGTLNGQTFLNISELVGNNNDSLTSRDQSNDWSISGTNSGTVHLTGSDLSDQITFSKMKNIIGLTGNDIFTFTSAGSLAGTIDGGLGNNKIISSIANGVWILDSTTIHKGTYNGKIFLNIGDITGSGSDSLTGRDQANDWTISGANSGKVHLSGADISDQIIFSGIGNVTGLTGADIFTISSSGSLTGAIDGGAGSNQLISNVASGLWVLDSSVAHRGTLNGKLFSNIANIVGSSSDSLTGRNQSNDWQITAANAGTVHLTGADISDQITFSGFKNLVGGTGNDSFTIAVAGSLSGSIDGGSNGTDKLISSAPGAAWTLDAATAHKGKLNAMVFSNVDEIVGSGNDMLTGRDQANTWNISGSNSGTVNLSGNTSDQIVFSGVSDLTGLSGIDTFILTAGGSLTGVIDGGSANNILINQHANAIWILDSSTALKGTLDGKTFLNIVEVQGSGNDSLTGRNQANDWQITAANSGTVHRTGNAADQITFSGINNIVGLAGVDIFTIASGGSISGSINGGTGSNKIISNMTNGAWVLDDATAHKGTVNGKSFLNIGEVAGSGSDTLTSRDQANEWDITGANSGTVHLSGADTSDQIVFSGISNLTGRSGVDIFTLELAGSFSGAINGGTGAANTLINKHLNAIWVLDSSTANKGTLDSKTFSNINEIHGSGSDSLTGRNQVNDWQVTSTDGGTVNKLADTSDQIIFNGMKTLNGGTNVDNFTFASAFSGDVKGGAGDDIFNINSIVVNLFGEDGNDKFIFASTGRATLIDGGNNTNTIVSPAGLASKWQLASANKGTLKNAADVDYVTTFQSIQTLQGSGLDSLTGINQANKWTITGANTGTLAQDIASPTDTINFSGISSLIGSAGDDKFDFSSSASSGISVLVDGGSGTNTIQARTNAANSWAMSDDTSGSISVLSSGIIYVNSFVNIQNQLGSNLGDHTVTDFWDLSKKLPGGSVIEGSGSGTSKLIGFNQDNQWTISGSNSGNITPSGGSTISFSGFKNLTGGTQNDTFTFTALGVVDGIVDGGAGTNTIVGRNATNTWQMTNTNAGRVSDTSAVTPYVVFNNVQKLVGGNLSDLLIGSTDVSNSSQQWNLDTKNTLVLNQNVNVLEFSAIENIQGGTGANTLVNKLAGKSWVLTGANQGTINTINFSNFGIIQGSGSDSLTARNQGNSWTITGADAGTLANTVTPTDDLISFSGMNNLIGGNAADIFTFTTGAISGAIDGGNSNGDTNNRLVAKNVANTWTMLDAVTGKLDADTGGNYVNSFTHIQTLQGGSATNKLIGANSNNTWFVDVNSVGTVTNNGVTTNFVSMSSLQGGTATDTLRGSDQKNTWSIDAANAGSITTLAANKVDFSNMKNLVGGVDVDDFTIKSGGSISGLIDGGTSATASGIQDSLNLSALTNVTVELFNSNSTNIHIKNIESIKAPSANTNTNTLLGASDVGYQWTIDNTNTGTVAPTLAATAENTLRFTDFNVLTGGTNSDKFAVIGAGKITGSIDGGGGAGIDLLDYSQTQSDVSIVIGGSGSFGGTGINGIEGVVGNNDGLTSITHNSTISIATTSTGDNTWTLGKFDVNDGINDGQVSVSNAPVISFENFNVINGGAGKDTINLTANGKFLGTIKGGGNNDVFDASASTKSQEVHINGVTAGVTNLFDINQIIANATTNSVLVSDASANTWIIDANSNGKLNNTISFSGFANLTGGALQDIFDIANTASLTGVIDGGAGAGANSIDLTHIANGTNVSVGVGSTATANLKIVNISKLDANTANTNTLIADNAGANLWSITDQNKGTLNTVLAFTGFANLTGRETADTFAFNGASSSLTGVIDGGAGADILDLTAIGRNANVRVVNVDLLARANNININNVETVNASELFTNTFTANDVQNNWNIVGKNSGNLTNVSTSNNIAFTNFSILIGGSKDDYFSFTPAASLTGYVDGGDHVVEDVVDFSQQTTVDISLGDVGTGYRHIERYIGNNTNSTLRGDNNNNIWTLGAQQNSGDINGVVNFTGFNNLIGGSGADTFNINQGELTGSISAGAGKDIFNVSNGVVRGTLNGDAGDDILNATIADAAFDKTRFVGGLDTNIVNVIGGGAGFTATHLNALKAGGTLRYDANAKTHTINYTDVTMVNDNVVADSLTLNGTVNADDFNLTANSYLLDSFTTINYQNKNNLMVAGAANDQVTINGSISIPQLFTIQNAAVIEGANGIINADGLRLDGTASVGSAANRLQVNVANLSVSAAQGDIYLQEQNGLNIAEYNTNNRFDLILDGNLTSGVPLTSSGDFNVAATGDIILDKDNALIGNLNLSSANNIALRNVTVTNLGNIQAQSLNLNSTGAIQDTGVITVDGAATFASAGNISLLNAANNFNSVTVSSGVNVSIKDINSLTLTSIGATGLVDTHSNGINVNGAVNVSGLSIDAGTGAAVLGNNIVADNSAAIVAQGITLGGNITAASIDLNSLQSKTILNGNLDTSTKQSISVTGSEIAQTGTINSGTTVTLNATGNITQNGNIIAGGDTAISAGKFVMSPGVSIAATAGSVNITSLSDMAVQAITASNNIDLMTATQLSVVDKLSATSGTISLHGGTDVTIGSDIAGNAGVTVISDKGGVLQQAQLGVAKGDINVTAAGDIAMSNTAITTATEGNISYAGANIALASLTSLKGTASLKSSGAITDINGVQNNVTSKAFIAEANTGIGALDAIETNVSALSLTNHTGDISITNADTVTIDKFATNGNINFTNLHGNVVLDNSSNPLFVTGDPDALLAGGTIDSNYKIGSLTVNMSNGSLIAAPGSKPNVKNPDITGHNATINITSGEFGEPSRPLVVYVEDTFFLNSSKSWKAYWGFDIAPLHVENRSTVQGSLSDLLSAGAEQLVVVEALNEINPAIFTGVRNYVYDDIAILLPPDQRFDDKDSDAK